MSRTTLWVIAICWVTIVFDGYDLIVFGAVVPSAARVRGVGPLAGGGGTHRQLRAVRDADRRPDRGHDHRPRRAPQDHPVLHHVVLAGDGPVRDRAEPRAVRVLPLPRRARARRRGAHGERDHDRVRAARAAQVPLRGDVLRLLGRRHPRGRARDPDRPGVRLPGDVLHRPRAARADPAARLEVPAGVDLVPGRPRAPRGGRGARAPLRRRAARRGTAARRPESSRRSPRCSVATTSSPRERSGRSASSCCCSSTASTRGWPRS